MMNDSLLELDLLMLCNTICSDNPAKLGKNGKNICTTECLCYIKHHHFGSKTHGSKLRRASIDTSKNKGELFMKEISYDL